MPEDTILPTDMLDAPASNDAAKAYELYSRLRRADLTSAGNRIAIQSMFDGAPPFDEDFLKRTGQAPQDRAIRDANAAADLCQQP